ncbi:hypothetical protein [Rhodopseudomonas telluris]|uniref:Uncharacterized protein n=1 Tax=Rhodopseudomonas telluris TaxID=644215 RepID=A0ABV6ERZ3_9BRAD
MTNDENSRPAARSGAAAQETDSGRAEREAAAKATLDNMARLRALRLAREAAEPQRAPTKTKRAKAGTGKTAGTRTAAGKSAEPTPRALSDWLAEQQKGGHRT